jgi:cytochrome c-type biogenesis protein CcmH/NrfF
MIRCFVILLLLLTATPILAQTETVMPMANTQLTDAKEEAAASELMKTLRCVECQGQSIADSDAPIAGMMRNEVRQRIAKGERPEEIRKWLVDRYGEYISFQPSFSGASLLLWLMPLIIGIFAIFMARSLFKGRPQ